MLYTSMNVSIQMPSSPPTPWLVQLGHSWSLSATQMPTVNTGTFISFFFLTMVSPSLPVASVDTQTNIDLLLSDLATWNATLHFVGVEGKGTDNVDLFELTQPKYRAAGPHQSTSPIIFNRIAYLPTEKCLKTLKLELISHSSSL
jgi:hypothetical protein